MQNSLLQCYAVNVAPKVFENTLKNKRPLTNKESLTFLEPFHSTKGSLDFLNVLNTRTVGIGTIKKKKIKLI